MTRIWAATKCSPAGLHLALRQAETKRRSAIDTPPDGPIRFPHLSGKILPTFSANLPPQRLQIGGARVLTAAHPILRPDERSSMTQNSVSRLSTEQVSEYWREGYLIYDEPVFPQTKFDALKAHFDEELAQLPPEVRPETMDVPHLLTPSSSNGSSPTKFSISSSPSLVPISHCFPAISSASPKATESAFPGTKTAFTGTA